MAHLPFACCRALDKPNLILMDSHYSHVFNYCYMKTMFDKDIKVMALEAHSSHYSQPLDKNPFSSFKIEFNNQMKKFNRTSGGRAITKAEFFPVFNLAWNRSMIAENIKAGFNRTGIWPPDSEALPDYLFAVNNQSESSGSVQFGVENCGQVQFVAQFPKAFFTVNTCTCTYVWI